MKKAGLFFSGLLLVTLASCDNAASKIESGDTTEVDASTVENTGSPSFSFSEENHDFGVIDEGTVAKHDFVFTNTGDAPLIITNAQGSCGCTVPDWPREPIAPGADGIIHVEFNSQGRAGNQSKQVTLSANTVPNTLVLNISAQVTAKPVSDEAPAEEVETAN